MLVTEPDAEVGRVCRDLDAQVGRLGDVDRVERVPRKAPDAAQYEVVVESLEAPAHFDGPGG